MSANGQLNGSLNGNGAHKPVGLLNGNGSLSYNQVEPKLPWYDRYIQPVSRAILWTLLAIGASCGLWMAYQQATAPKPPIPSRIQRIEKAIDGLQDAIDLLQEELPSQEEEQQYPDR